MKEVENLKLWEMTIYDRKFMIGWFLKMQNRIQWLFRKKGETIKRNFRRNKGIKMHISKEPYMKICLRIFSQIKRIFIHKLNKKNLKNLSKFSF